MAGTHGGDMGVRNVKLHHRGKTEKGVLTLGRDHLVFTYVVDAATSAESGGRSSIQSSRTPRFSADSSSVSQRSLEVPPSDAAAGRAAIKAASERQKPRTKSTWVAYAMINSCVLRPSHSRHQAVSSEPHDDSGVVGDGSDDMFPPSYGTGAYGRPSTDSPHFMPSPLRPASPAIGNEAENSAFESGRSPALRIKCRDFRQMAFHFYAGANDEKTADDIAREVFFALRSRCCPNKIEDMLAFHFPSPPEERQAALPPYDARREFARMGIGEKAPDGPGSAWRITDINNNYEYSPTYPSLLCVPRAVSDNLLKYGGEFRSKSRIPALSYLHSNGGSITRSSQPRVGVQGKRNPQDERLVSAIFSSHTPPMSPVAELPNQLASTSLAESDDLGPMKMNMAEAKSSASGPSQKAEEDTDLAPESLPARRRVYGSSRRNLIVDARPRINALANRATGGGIEDIANYAGSGDVPVERVMLNIQNIHVMRDSLQRVIDSLGSADYLAMPPNQDLLRKSGWLGHIAGLLEGSELVVRAVGLGASHALVHCSDGWDRTAQVSALAQVMLDPYARTLDGFVSLIRKDFLSFGHKFQDRSGSLGSEKWFEIENERIAPSRSREEGSTQPTGLNAMGAKALTGAKSWFDKNRASIFRQQNASEDNLSDAASRPASPPPNGILHSPASANSKADKEHHMSEKEISPVFHQFLDATYQLQHQYPDAFEFNERFLLRLLYHVYAGQYVEFLFNCERDRAQYADKLPSVWGHFFARRAEFINPSFAGMNSLLFAKRGADGQIGVRWWSKLFGVPDEQMNVPRTLFARPPLPQALDVHTSSSSSLTDRVTEPEVALRPAKSPPALGSIGAQDGAAEEPLIQTLGQPSTETDPNMVIIPVDAAVEPSARDQDDFDAPSQPRTSTSTVVVGPQDPEAEDGDPLGVTEKKVSTTTNNNRGSDEGRLDFAAFASQNRFRD
ncbi:hypothetical protein LTR62_004462 [Meristemomyces frigidus]|uniref:Myotubularin phosphatase domain-containing protein n=1 Tax=Meristemomyces frigidus TaxID=1508187 RepID=A0AAN7TEK7_9PEZI|nr:hypothetical protein LTR62_004462 [Meristemomyces frigidus]